VGRAQHLCNTTLYNFSLRARRTGFYHGVGAPTGSRYGAPAFRFAPVLCCQANPRWPSQNEGRHPGVPHSPSRPLSFPSRFFSKHKTLYEKSLICGICSGFARYYNLIIVKPGAPHPPPRNSARLFYSYRAGPMLLGVSYVQITVVYIRNIIPLGGTLLRQRP
jgi:hypothetical protein